MLCTVVVVFTLTGLCRGTTDTSSRLPQLPPLPTASPRMSQAQLVSLRRQLMRDNYDYQNYDDKRGQQHDTETNIDDHTAKFYNPQDGADHLHRASELDQANDNSYSVELNQQDTTTTINNQYQQDGKHDQPGIYEQRRPRAPGHPHEQLDNNENRGRSEQPTEHEQPDRYDQQTPRKQQQQRGRNNQLDKYKHRGQNTQSGEHEQSGQYEQRRPLELRNQDEQRGPHEQRGQNTKLRRHTEPGINLERRQNDQRELGEPQQQLGQFDEQMPSMEHTDRAAPLLADVPPAPPAPPEEYTVREREYPPARHAAHSDWPVEDNNKRRNSYGPEPSMQRRPFGDLRGSYPEVNFTPQFPRADAPNDQRMQKEKATEYDAQSPEQEPSPDEREAFDREAFEQQEKSGSETEGSDVSDSQKQPEARYDEFRPQGRQHSRVTRSTRANRLQYYTPPPTRRAPPPQYNRMPNAPPPQYDRMPNAPPPQYDRIPNAPPKQYNRMPNAPPYRHRNRPLGRHHSAPRHHNNSKKDLLYYVDDNQRRHMSPDLPDDDQSSDDEPHSPQPNAGSLHNTTSIHPNPDGSRNSTVSVRPSTFGIRPNPVRPRAGSTRTQVNHARSQASLTAAGSLHKTTGVYPNPAGSRHSTISAHPRRVGHQTSPISSRAGPTGIQVNPAGFQASPTGSRLKPIGSRASPANTHSKPPRHADSTGPPDLPRSERARSFVVTVSPNNVTYKLWTLKSHEGRRRVERRLLEERGPEGVAIISLDRAPLPVFRLPRARRQYMHDHRHHRHHRHHHHQPA